MNPRNFLIALVAGVGIAVGVLFSLKQNAPTEPEVAFVLPAPESLPAFELTDQSGTTFTPESFAGQWDVVFFGFTSCPDICPTTLQQLSLAKRQMQESGIEELPRIVLVSVDPERDTPELMGQYVDYFGDGNIGLSGTLEETRKLAKGLYVFFDKVPLDGNEYTVDHSPAVLVVDPNGHYYAGFGGSQTAEIYASDLQILMDGK